MLLADIRTAFDEQQVERMATSTMLDLLNQREDRQWMEYRRGRPLSPVQLAKLLRPFDIRPSNHRTSGGRVRKGYTRAQFTDAWSRYLETDSPPRRAATPLRRHEQGG